MTHVRLTMRWSRRFTLPSRLGCLHARMGNRASCFRQATMQRQWTGLLGGTVLTKTYLRYRTRPWARTSRQAASASCPAPASTSHLAAPWPPSTPPPLLPGTCATARGEAWRCARATLARVEDDVRAAGGEVTIHTP